MCVHCIRCFARRLDSESVLRFQFHIELAALYVRPLFHNIQKSSIFVFLLPVVFPYDDNRDATLFVLLNNVGSRCVHSPLFVLDV